MAVYTTLQNSIALAGETRPQGFDPFAEETAFLRKKALPLAPTAYLPSFCGPDALKEREIKKAKIQEAYRRLLSQKYR